MNELQQTLCFLSDSLEGQNCLYDLKSTAMDVVISLNLKAQNKLTDETEYRKHLQAFNKAYQNTIQLEPSLREKLPTSLRQAALAIARTKIL